VDDLSKALDAFVVVAGIFCSRRLGPSVWSEFTQDLEAKRAFSLSPIHFGIRPLPRGGQDGARTWGGRSLDAADDGISGLAFIEPSRRAQRRRGGSEMVTREEGLHFVLLNVEPLHNPERPQRVEKRSAASSARFVAVRSDLEQIVLRGRETPFRIGGRSSASSFQLAGWPAVSPAITW